MSTSPSHHQEQTKQHLPVRVSAFPLLLLLPHLGLELIPLRLYREVLLLVWLLINGASTSLMTCRGLAGQLVGKGVNVGGLDIKLVYRLDLMFRHVLSCVYAKDSPYSRYSTSLFRLRWGGLWHLRP